METLKRAWEAWKAFGKKLGNFQARVLLQRSAADQEASRTVAGPSPGSLRHRVGAQAVEAQRGRDHPVKDFDLS
jgi:hypothetical protein